MSRALIWLLLMAASHPGRARSESPSNTHSNDWTPVDVWNCIKDSPSSCVGGTSIQKTAAGEYREAGARMGDRFVYAFRLSKSAMWVRATVDYPDDKIRCAGVSAWGPPQEVLGSGYMCGDEIPITNSMQRRQFVFFSSSQDAALVFSTEAQDQPVAISRLQIEETSALPTQQSQPTLRARHHRRVGLSWEDPILPRCFGVASSTDAASFDLGLQRCIEYMRWAELNEIDYPVYWYTGPMFQSRTTPNYPVAGREHPPDSLARMANELSKNDIAFVPSLNVFKLRQLRELSLSEDQVVEGKLPSINTVSANGRIVTWENARNWRDCALNPLHPSVQDAVRSLCVEVAGQCSAYSSFQGVNLELWPGTILKLGSSTPGDAPISFDDYSVEHFCDEMKLSPPGAHGDKSRFAQRAKLMKSDASRWKQWLEWRAARMTKFYCSLADEIAKAKPGAQVGLCIYLGYGRPENEAAGIAGQIFASGVDLDALSKNPNISIKRYAHQMLPRWRLRNGMPRPRNLNIENSPEFQSIFAKRPGMGLIVHQQYFETRADPRGTVLSLPSPFLPEHVALQPNAGMRVIEPLATGRDCLRFFAAAIRNYDPVSMTVGGYVLGTQGSETELREMAANFSSLPAVSFSDVFISDALVVRSAEAEGKSWVYVVNLLGSEQTVSLTVIGGTLADCVTGAEFPDDNVIVTLKPYELRSMCGPLQTAVSVRAK